MNNQRYDIDFLKNKYHQRWPIETLFSHTKLNIHLESGKGQSEVMVLQEICGKFIVHLIAQISTLQSIDSVGGIIKTTYPYNKTNVMVKNGHKYNYSTNFTETVSSIIPKLGNILHPMLTFFL